MAKSGWRGLGLGWPPSLGWRGLGWPPGLGWRGLGWHSGDYGAGPAGL